MASPSRCQKWTARLIFWTLIVLCFNFGTATDTSPWPVHNNGLQELIQWDHYSLLINGERLFLFGGEMHPFRLPVPELWEDILHKIKAMGLRMVSIYVHWGFHTPTPNTVDFTTGPRNLTRFFELAKAVGLYVMVRPGPYINGELSAGGMALWATTGAYSPLRTDSTAFSDAWIPYQDAIAQVTRPFQLTENGTVILYQIENEFGSQWRDANNKVPNPAAIAYMEQLKANARKNGITVPLTHNMPNQNAKSWSADYDTVNAGGNVDIYGLDSYVRRPLPHPLSSLPLTPNHSLNAGPATSPSATIPPPHPGRCPPTSRTSSPRPQPNRPSSPSSKAARSTRGPAPSADVRPASARGLQACTTATPSPSG